MPSLQIGRTTIPYELRRSATASERRIIVTPGHVEVLALTTDDEEAVTGFLDRKRQWLFNTVREMERITTNRHAVPRFSTGSKIPYRGRRHHLTVRRHDGEAVEVVFRNGFIIDLPTWVSPETADSIIASELKLWLKRQVRRDVMNVASRYTKKYGLKPAALRVGDIKHGWGVCGPNGHIIVNWTLVFAPRAVLEYVIAHELVHLRFRNHGAEFWSHLRLLLPSYEHPKQWLDSNPGALAPDFLIAPRSS